MPDTPKPHNKGTHLPKGTYLPKGTHLPRGAGFPARVEVLFDPPASAWTGVVRAQPDDQTARDTRRALGLPTDRPIIMGGHQPGLWHAGILAKWFAVEAVAARVGGAGAWVVVDQSPGAGCVIEYPLVSVLSGIEPPARAGEHAHLSRGEIVFGDADAPPASQRPARVETPQNAALRGVSTGFAHLAQLLEHHAKEPTLAHQLHAACVDVIEPLAQAGESLSDMHSIFATDLHITPAFAEMVGAMRADPVACAQLYNEAAAKHPEAGVRELTIIGNTVELPLWERIDSPNNAPTPWRTVMSDRLPDLPDDRLVLRGLPMTGLLRRWACDLFVHGTGGGASHAEAGYDRVTERWLAAWLGADDLAPAVVASATLRLDFSECAGAGDVPTPREIARARALAHRAAHDPSLLGAADLGSRKRDLARQMVTLPRRSAERAALYAQMQALRAEAHRTHADRLAEFHALAHTLAARANEAGIIADRTWSIAFHTPAAMAHLRESIDAAFG